MSYDPHYSNVSLLLNCDGADGSTTFTDNGPGAKTVSITGDARVKTSSAKFGTGGCLLDGTGDYLSIPASSDFAFGTGDFSLEFWIKTSDSGESVIVDQYSAGSEFSSWQLSVKTGVLSWYRRLVGGSSSYLLTGSTTISDNTWHHIAVTRASNTLMFFVDGVADGSVTDSSDYATSVVTLSIGAQVYSRNSSYDLAASLDDIRITKGVARYTAAFTSPAAAFPDEGLILATAPVLAPSPSVIAHGGGSVSIQSPLPLMSAGIEFSANSDLQCPSPLITVLAGGTVSANSDLQCPSPLITVLAGGTVSANSDLQCPSPLITVLAGGTVSATAPPPRLLSIARDSTGDYAASLTAPRPTLTAFGAATAHTTAPKPTLASGGTVVAMGSASVASPSVLVQSEGRASAMVRADLRAPSASLIGYGGAVVSVTLSGKATVEASGTTGGIAGASLKCPLFQLSAEATAQNYGSASLIAPSSEIGRTVQAWVAAPAARLTAIGTAVVTATFDAYVVNLLHRGGSTVDEVTHYTNFPFTHVVRYQNSYYGVNSTGLYLLEGTTDDGDPIEWAVQTAMEDFGSPRRKTVDSVYIEGRLGSATTVSLQSGEKTPNTYSHTTPRGATAQNHRQKLGRGVKERYHALGLAGDGEFELDAVEFNERETNRRI